MANILFERFVYLSCVSIFLLMPRNCKQWLQYQQCWENHKFRIDGLEDLDTISLIDVYEWLIHVAIQ